MSHIHLYSTINMLYSQVISASKMCSNFANMSRVPVNIPYHQNYDEVS